MKKYVYPLCVGLLCVILVIVSFFIFFIHIPSYNHHRSLDLIRNQICEENHYDYADYFNVFYGDQTYYILKVNIHDQLTYLAYDKELEIVDYYQGDVALSENIIQSIKDKYDIKINQLDIGYEQGQFVYFAKYQTTNEIMYIYYTMSSGEFLKMVKIGE